MFDEELDVRMPPRRHPRVPPTLAGFYRTLGLPAFWDGAHAVREAMPSSSVHGMRRIVALRRAAVAGVPVQDVPELREWQAHTR